MASESTKRIEEALRRIPRGRVSTYGAIGAIAGLSNGARQVVRVLHAMAERDGLPWHRVLRKDGSIALPPGGGLELQAALLADEGVEVGPDGRVDLGRYGWEGGVPAPRRSAAARKPLSRGERGRAGRKA
jgi:methylated-DNA-protein-cysteine methyltransferase related protein